MTDRRTEILKSLRESAYQCTADDFRELLHRFSADDDALSALHQGVLDRAKVEDRGDYTSAGTPGYAALRQKEKLLQECYLGMPPFDAVKTADTATIEALQETVTELTARVAHLEKNNKSIRTPSSVLIKRRKP